MIKGGNSIDDGIIDFCKKYQLGEEEELEKIIINNENNLLTTRTELNSANPKSNIYIINKNPDYDFYRYYLVELILRGNLISASNIICLEILNEYGGVYLSTDLLPAINENLFRYLIDKTSEDPEGIQNQAIIIKFILNELVQDGKMLGRTKKPIDGMDSKKKAAIQERLEEAKQKNIPLFVGLGNIKVDPYFQFLYSADDVKAMVAKKGDVVKGNPFIIQMQANLKQTYDIIFKYDIHTSKEVRKLLILASNQDPTLIFLQKEMIPKIQTAIKNAGLKINIKAIFHYRLDILNQYEQATPEILGMPAYDFAYSQLLNKIFNKILDENGNEVSPTDPYFFQQKITFSFKAATFLTEEATQSSLRGSNRYLEPLTNRPQYGGQYIIQANDDAQSTKIALFLYNQHRDMSDWYLYDGKNDRLIYRMATEDENTEAKIQQGKNIILVGNSSAMTFLYALRIVEQLKKILQPASPHYRTRVSLLACQSATVISGDKNLFISTLYNAFEQSIPKIKVAYIISQKSLFTVDVMGRRWKGNLPEFNADVPLAAGIHWCDVTDNDTEIMASRCSTGLALSYTTQSLGSSMLMHNNVITEFNNTAFGLGSVMETLNFHPEKRVAWMNNLENLDGWIDLTVAEGLLKNLREGVVIIPAESMALAVAMGKLTHELIINDPNLDRIIALMKALKRSLEAESYVDWLESLNLSYGKKQFERLVNTLFKTPNTLEQAFKRLQSRVRANRFTFFNLNLDKEGAARHILQGMKSDSVIKAIFLGDIERQLLRNIAINDDEQFQITEVARTIKILESNFKILIEKNADQSNPPPLTLYSYSLWDPNANVSLEQQNMIFLQKNYANSQYIQRVGQLTWSKGFHPSLINADQYSHAQAWIREHQALRQKNRVLAQGEWLELLSQLKYDPIDATYTVSYLNLRSRSITEVSSKNSMFADMTLYLDKRAQLIRKNYSLTRKKQVLARSIGHMGGAGGIGSFDDSIVSLYHSFKQLITSSEGEDDPLSATMKFHVWVSLVSDFNNVVSAASTLTEGSYRFAESIINIGWLFKRLREPINYLWNYSHHINESPIMKRIGKSTTELGLTLGFTGFLLNAYEYYEAENDRQRNLALTRMVFDGVGLTFSIGSLSVMESTWTLPPMLAVILVGYGLSKVSEKISAKIEGTINNTTKARLCGMCFNHLKKSLEQGGFTIINKALQPLEGAVIKTINLEDSRAPTVIFDETGVQIRKKTTQGKNLINNTENPKAYINLYHLSGMKKDQVIAITDLPAADQPAVNTLILPRSPRTKIDPVYAKTDFIKWRDDAEFYAMRYFAKKDPHFIFNFYKKTGFLTDSIEKFIGLDWMALTELKCRYEKTDVNIYLGREEYNLIAPGIKEDQKIEDSVYRKYLHYILHAPKEGKAIIFLVLSRGQADITLECNNMDVTWIISANHKYLRDMRLQKTLAGYKFIENVPAKQGEKDSIVLNITNLARTQATFHLYMGVATTDLHGRLIVRELNAQKVLEELRPASRSINYMNTEGIIKADLAAMIPKAKSRQVAQYTRIQNFTLKGDEESCHVYYYSYTNDFVRTENKIGTFFYNTKRQNVQLLLFSERYAWFKGDLLIPIDVNGIKYIYAYRNIIWMSEAENKELVQIYFPIGYLPDILNPDGTIKFSSPAKLKIITKLKDENRFIFLEQSYTYKRRDIDECFFLQYCIDSQYPEKGLTLIEARSLPAKIKNEIIETISVEAFSRFMQAQSHSDFYKIPEFLRKIDPWTRAGKNIKPLFNGITDTIISIKRRFIWPLKNSIHKKGYIIERIPLILSGHTDNIHYAGTTMVEIHENNFVNQPTNRRYYHFWSTTDREQKFEKLYVQQDDDTATEMLLIDFNIQNDQVLSIKETIITTTDGLLYALYDDQSLSFVGMGKNWLREHADWWVYFREYIDELTNKMEGLVPLSIGQTKTIKISSYLTLSGLQQNDEAGLLAVWYDRDSKSFIICQRDNNQQLSYLGIDRNSQKGAWLMNIREDKSKEIGYINTMTSDEVMHSFHKTVLRKMAVIPDLIKVISKRERGTVLYFTQVNAENNGYIKGTTTDGLLLQISRENRTFKIILLAVTPAFTDHYVNNLSGMKNELSELNKVYTYPEIIKIMLSNDQQGWYYPKINILFMPIKKNEATIKNIYNLNQYLGFNQQTHCAYFISNSNHQSVLIKMYQNDQQNGAIKEPEIISNQELLYERTDALLILNSGRVSTLANNEYVNIHVPALLITTPVTQDKFNYPVIYLEHANEGSMRCIMPDAIPETVLISRKFNFLCLFVRNNLFIINHSFRATGNHSSSRLQLLFKGIIKPASNFSNHYSVIPGDVITDRDTLLFDVFITVEKLTKYYIEQADENTKDGHVIIPLPKLSS